MGEPRLFKDTILEMIGDGAHDADRAALIGDGGPTLTYAGLVRCIADGAARLRAMGFSPGECFAVVTDGSVESAVAMLATMEAGACAPLNPSAREREIETLLQGLDAAAVVTRPGTGLRAREVAQRLAIPCVTVSLDDDGAALDMALSGATGRASHTRSSAALLLHTSGSTGHPKLVPLTRAMLCRSADNTAGVLGLTAQDVCLNVMPLFHVHGLVGAMLSSLARGAAVVCTGGFRAPAFHDWMARYDPTWYSAVPTIHQAVSDCLDDAPLRRHRLRFVRSSSSPLAPALMRKLGDQLGVPVVEAYGMTEATHQVASNPVTVGRQKPGSVGIAAGPEIAVVDAGGAFVGAGVTGEVVIRGHTVIESYLGDARANSAGFVGGWFRTGDRGLLDDDGYLFLTGRSREMINRGGETIAPREIDEVLLECPGVAQAMAFGMPDARLGETVAAAVVGRPGHDAPSAQAVRQFAAQRLAGHKVPEVVHVVDSLPKGDTGKLQRGRLAEAMRTSGPAPAEADPMRPQSETVRHIITELWQRCLGVDDAQPRDHFMDLGGDSVAAAELLDAIHDATGIDIPLLAFLDDPTIFGLQAYCGDRPRRIGNDLCPVVTIRQPKRKDAAKPVFCIPPHHDELWGLSSLARHLHEDRPAHALRGGSSPDDVRQGIPAVADRNIELMKTVQGEPPYTLIGFCFGGYIAIEMASQLADRGETVDCVTLIDAFNPDWYRKASPAQRRYHEGKQSVYAMLYRARRRLSRPPNLRWRRNADARPSTGRANLISPASLAHMEDAAQHAREAYRPRAFDGPVLLVRSIAPRPYAHHMAKMGWEDCARGDTVELRLWCDRPEIWQEPHVRRAAAAIETMIGAPAR